MAAIYRDLATGEDRTRQITADVAAALARGRHCLVLTQWIAHLQKLVDALRGMGYDLSHRAEARLGSPRTNSLSATVTPMQLGREE